MANGKYKTEKSCASNSERRRPNTNEKVSSIAPGAIVSVSLVRMSPDLSYAKVYLSAFPLTDKEAFLKAVSIKSAEIRNELGKLVRHQLRIVPELSFYTDDSVDYAENIERLLKGDDPSILD